MQAHVASNDETTSRLRQAEDEVQTILSGRNPIRARRRPDVPGDAVTALDAELKARCRG